MNRWPGSLLLHSPGHVHSSQTLSLQ